MEQLRQELKIKGSRIYLRPITIEDTECVVRWRNDKKVVENFIYRKNISKEEHLNWFHNKVETGDVIQFIICDNKTDKALGSIYLQNFNLESRQAEEGIFLGEEEAYGRGIGTEAAALVLKYAFETLKLHKLTARVLSYNQGSRRMHEKAGYVMESYLKDELFLDGKYEDLILLEDGTCSVDSNRYEMTYNTIESDYGRENFIFNYYKYRGYKDLDSLFNDCVTKQLDKYEYESNVKK